ncbi:anthranilate phosphoribosyltransferase [Roseisolibacter sp. H3M3-2]|uniref:anthranilate phosphoribosyltransferase n=1 Tax=Roseisolibacter sp. H3M3-2 TaxID=3031323 RepID=UPI0023DA1E4D|nr:anthranilate phosphoribosyltransferase [Roseisolibacter sp. H3M3-2]MDF1501529.1 anthranilate phosphoribosyltransferase [Roseisolibacter sp. H3M3-2]
MNAPTPDALRVALRALAGGEAVAPDAVTAAFDVVMRGEATPAQIAALLMGLRVQGETADVVAAVARSLRGAMLPLATERPDELVDTCGTGGGAVTTFNISTAAALLAAGAGARVAKHGNRSFTSRSGSADVLEALGVPIDRPVERMRRSLDETGLVFMFAPLMHPAMRHVGPVRRELGVPTVMNVVGPLANPASAGRQVVGVAEAHRLPLIAGALAALGSVRALVVHGEPGMDEVSPLGPTRALEIRDGRLAGEWTLDPAAVGLAAVSPDDLSGGSPEENAAIIEAVLGGGGPPGARAAVLLNAAAALYVGELEGDYPSALRRATAALDDGAGRRTLEGLRRVYRD